MDAVLDIIKNSPKGCTSIDIENIRQILENIDINIQNSQGKTILALCCDNYHNYYNIEVIKLLLKNGADVNIQDNYGDTALSHCCGHRSVEIVNLLIQYKVNVNHQDNKGLTALMLSSINSNENDIEIAKLLIRNGANVNLQDIKGNTAIKNASRYTVNKTYSLKMSQLLLEYDAEPHDTQDINIFIFADNITKLNVLS